MNWKNTIFWEEDGYMYGEWMSRDRNDPDDDGVPVYKEKVLLEDWDNNKNDAIKAVKGLLTSRYDKWIEETRF